MKTRMIIILYLILILLITPMVFSQENEYFCIYNPSDPSCEGELQTPPEGVVWCGNAICEEGENIENCQYDCSECKESWSCGDWSDCVNGSQTRICTDYNTCSTINNKPIDIRTCLEDTSVNKKRKEYFNIDTLIIISSIVLAVFIFIIILILQKKKKRV